MYGMNRFNFCTGKSADSECFWRFPISRRYIPLVTDLGIYFRATNPSAESSKRVAHFIKAVARLAKKLDQLVVVASSDRFYEAKCPWDILFCDHPVSRALVSLIERKTVKHFRVRVHNGACFFPGFGRFLEQLFNNFGPTVGQSLTYTQSCTCPQGCPHHPATNCFVYGWSIDKKDKKPIEHVVDPVCIESCLDRMMDLHVELCEIGLFPPRDDINEEVEEYDLRGGPYLKNRHVKDDYGEKQPAFDSGLCYNKSGCVCLNCSNFCNILSGQTRRYRGTLRAPQVWNFRQTMITDYFNFIDFRACLAATLDRLRCGD